MSDTKRPRGRPALGAAKRHHGVKVSLNDAELALIDDARGTMNLATFIREKALSSTVTDDLRAELKATASMLDAVCRVLAVPATSSRPPHAFARDLVEAHSKALAVIATSQQ